MDRGGDRSHDYVPEGIFDQVSEEKKAPTPETRALLAELGDDFARASQNLKEADAAARRALDLFDKAVQATRPGVEWIWRMDELMWHRKKAEGVNSQDSPNSQEEE